ncbi:hypothetical protein BH24ACT15_BH24ACT15_04000 [soil metagenome]
MARGRQLVLWPLLAAALGVATAMLASGAALLFLQVIPESDEPWGDLGRIFLSILFAVIAGVVVWVVGLARAARRLFAPGRRLVCSWPHRAASSGCGTASPELGRRSTSAVPTRRRPPASVPQAERLSDAELGNELLATPT